MKYIKSYENISMSNYDIIEILKSLETEDNKNAALISRLVNYSDKSGKNVLMSVVSSNNIDLIDYILKFKVDLNQVVKNTGENVLFFCKSLKVFNKLYDLGANVNQVTRIKRTILSTLARKKLFNVELYQKIINDGVDINQSDVNGSSVLSESILNKKILDLLIKNKVNLNGSDQSSYLYQLTYELRYYNGTKKNIILNIFKTLFENGMAIKNIESFSKTISISESNFNIIDDFMTPLKKYMFDDFISLIYNRISHETVLNTVEVAKKLLRLGGAYPNFYNKLKINYRERFYEKFADFIEENPFYDDIHKFNL